MRAELAAGALLLLASTAMGEPRVRPRERPGPQHGERLLRVDGDEIDASAALDEMLDDLASDLIALGAAATSPLLINRVAVSETLNPGFALLLRARLGAALAYSANISVVDCAECKTARGRVVGGELVVSRGMASAEERRRVAAAYGARALLDVTLTYQQAPDALALDVQLIRAEDSTVAFAEGYRVDPRSGMLYRGADSAQSRAEALADLEDRLNGRPHFGYGASFGAMLVNSGEPKGAILGVFGSARFYEKFGVERQYSFGLNAGGFIHSSRLAAAIVAASVMVRLTQETLYGPSFSAGGSVGGFLTGGGGNTPLASLNAEYLFGHRLALQVSVAWVPFFNLANKGYQVGGLCPQAGMAVLW